MKTIILNQNSTELQIYEIWRIENLSRQFRVMVFEQLVTLTLESIYVTYIRCETFANLERLQTLNLNLPAVLELPEHLFDQLPDLLSLNLQLRAVRSLHCKVFDKNKRLNQLRIYSNIMIFNIKILEHILEQLLVLEINNSTYTCTQFSNKQILMKQSLEKLEKCRLQIHDFWLLNVIANVRRLNLLESRLSEPMIEKVKNFNKLRFLNVRNCYGTFPGSHFRTSTRLLVLILAQNYLGHVCGRDLGNLPSLLHLDLRECHITKLIDWNIGRKCSSLNYLSLKSNRLDTTSFDRFTFENLCYLRKLDLSSNLIERFDHENIFDSLINLQILLLNSNLISHLPARCFGAMENLEILDLSKNKLMYLTADSFCAKGHPNFQSIDLHSNEIRELDDKLMKLWPNLKVLNLHDNFVECFDRIAFKYVPFIRTVDISFNAIRYLENQDMKWFRNLKFLNFEENLLQRIEAETFECLNRLKVLNLRSNENLLPGSVRALRFSYRFERFGVLLFDDN